KKHHPAYAPSPYLTFSVHLDGPRHIHDASVAQPGAFDLAVEAVRLARHRGFRVTINCTLYQGVTPPEIAEFFDFMMSLGVEAITVTPGFNYDRASSQESFLKRAAGKRVFREIFKLGRGRGWTFNHTNLYLDFLAGNRIYQCTPWGTPTRNIFGWQRPCYLLLDEGSAPSFKALMEETEWGNYGLGRNPKCANCMLHSGFEATAVGDMLAHPLGALRLAFHGIRTGGPMAPDPITCGE
ncbi:MAG: adenosyl-hopene transferase HpnH, partial [Deltaproteobacteria bacterium]|nr:adenosyl-hopene transferase HpnH [Deltaproteobacteria bacterium]